ncbi:hypothetical protein BCR37DRAFT_24524 [Protomyces lactucae-debilis]|uniref:G-protein coupled receptors family 2 profile 2 domain-containing protein n=1 Tax=Protomyces lactucae-debilis TaxID=2754530 RepID=A0A1Y2FDH2_PROLT|nr:uncharacterized protein BCR37DRAFT_24524 [Protomyces lactucae-debilis]ORY81970.1 hypothetical protein BCR37DRAFT_24524 [Protomyces lactucae-debilis]
MTNEVLSYAPIQLSDSALKAINDSGMAVAAISLAVGVFMLLIIAIQYYRFPKQVLKLCSSGPTMLLYASLVASIPFSVFWIVSCSPAASNKVACEISMWAIVFFLNLIIGFLTVMLLLCAFLLSPWPKLAGCYYRNWYLCFFFFLSLGLSLVGIFTGTFGYLVDQDTCWVIATKTYDTELEETRAKYVMLVIMIYGPLYASLFLNLGLFAYVVVRLNKVWEDRSNLGVQSTQDFSRALTRRVAFIPVAIGTHALLVIGGDLPITYKTTTAMFMSFFCNYIGFSSFTICVAMCAALIDPGFRKILRLNHAAVARAAELEAGGRISYVGSYKYMDGNTKHASTDSPAEIAMMPTSPTSPNSPFSQTSSSASTTTRSSRKWIPAISAHELPELAPARMDPLPQIPSPIARSPQIPATIRTFEFMESVGSSWVTAPVLPGRQDSLTVSMLPAVTLLAAPPVMAAQGRIWEPNFPSALMVEDEELVVPAIRPGA